MECKPVAYDKSIVQCEGGFDAIIRKDDDVQTFRRSTMKEAQALLACFPADVFEGMSVPTSVFCPGRRPLDAQLC